MEFNILSDIFDSFGYDFYWMSDDLSSVFCLDCPIDAVFVIAASLLANVVLKETSSWNLSKYLPGTMQNESEPNSGTIAISERPLIDRCELTMTVKNKDLNEKCPALCNCEKYLCLCDTTKCFAPESSRTAQNVYRQSDTLQKTTITRVEKHAEHFLGSTAIGSNTTDATTVGTSLTNFPQTEPPVTHLHTETISNLKQLHAETGCQSNMSKNNSEVSFSTSSSASMMDTFDNI